MDNEFKFLTRKNIEVEITRVFAKKSPVNLAVAFMHLAQVDI